MDDLAQNKRDFRRLLRGKLDSLSAVDREHAAASACVLLQIQAVWQEARSVFFYSPLPNELNIWALVPEALRLGKAVFLPKFDAVTNAYIPCRIENLETDLKPGRFGINEPVGTQLASGLNQLDLILVPGVGFDALGGRVGRGAGYYDRMLANIAGHKCGVAFDEQMTDRIPVEDHDVRMNSILTPNRWILVQSASSE